MKLCVLLFHFFKPFLSFYLSLVVIAIIVCLSADSRDIKINK